MAFTCPTIINRLKNIFEWPQRWWRGGDRTANATVLLALGTVILACVNLGMLIEMHFSGHRQHKDTITALNRTDATIAAQTVQANIMRGQLREMENAQRPWITADITPFQDAIFSGNGVDFGLQFTLRNTGHTPAWAFISINAVPLPENAAEVETATCASSIIKSMGLNVFPDERVSLNVGFEITMKQLDEMWRRFPTMKPAFYPFVVACIIYSSLSNDETHHTPLVYNVRRQSNSGFC